MRMSVVRDRSADLYEMCCLEVNEECRKKQRDLALYTDEESEIEDAEQRDLAKMDQIKRKKKVHDNWNGRTAGSKRCGVA